ncbi:hypothetical protein [Actinoplanes xinjiangensis]|jgi:hypothetical protein|uniref:PH (Pleckstrin Homology) domain-containing protein n=1 Tax=Actinoplanes xinjiangensis TaxID=512350 RepID=A0A316EQA4_9ACTN|nr:hypothetical protein [Actinoplanes xinjiangensis]PWK34624.1 hypothetical protein BC793_12616 [Actinoplanes xinjiangensis]GIF43219.1 hypothetical protein Axi01nite_75300 [Actinoplanes xinjiangensis]
MDVFLSTFHPAAEATAALPQANRHLPILRSCVDSDDPAVLVARCVRPGAPLSGDWFLLLTGRRLVVTQDTRPLHRLRLHLNANLRHLSNVTWRLDLSKPGIELAVTAIDGVRERFRMRLGDSDTVWRAESLLREILIAKPACV